MVRLAACVQVKPRAEGHHVVGGAVEQLGFHRHSAHDHVEGIVFTMQRQATGVSVLGQPLGQGAQGDVGARLLSLG